MKKIRIKRFAKETAKRCICRLSFHLSNYDEKILILGDGRSGTNWLMEILNFDDRYRVVYEPFHGWEFRPRLPEEAEYPFPKLHEKDLERQFEKVARGAFITRNVTIYRPKLSYDGLLIKDVNAHLIADQLDFFAGLQKLLILRHPFAVAASKLRYKTHHWPTRAHYFLTADRRVSEKLADQADLIEAISKSEDMVLNWICVWCILHKVLFCSATAKSFKPVFYEELAAKPEDNIQEIYSALGMQARLEENRALVMSKINRLSRTAQTDHSVTDTRAGIAAWKRTLDTSQIAKGLEILAAFGLQDLYGDDHFPLIQARQLEASWVGA